MTETKRCGRCKCNKSLSEFDININREYKNTCRKCIDGVKEYNNITKRNRIKLLSLELWKKKNDRM